MKKYFLILFVLMSMSFQKYDDLSRPALKYQNVVEVLMDIEQEGNLCFSPYSLREAMKASYLGSANKTREEIRDFFDYEDDQKEFLERHKKDQISFHESLEAEGVSFKYSNQVDLNTKNVTWSRSYLDLLKNELKATVSEYESKNFEALCLTQSSKFKGEWLHGFDPKSTTKRSFTNSDKSQSEVEMMNQELATHFFSSEHYEMVELAYKNQDFSLLLVKPKTGKVKTLFKDYERALRYGYVSVTVPKFKLNSELSLLETLANRGLKSVTRAGQPDFSAMFFKTLSAYDMYIKSIEQSNVFDLDEKGTIAESETTVRHFSIGCSAANRPFPIESFVFDEAFQFYLIHKPSSQVLFAGKVNKL